MLAIKLGADNARRKLLLVLGEALAPTDTEYDQSARNRTLVELLHAPGSLRFDDDCVHVTLDLLLPPTSHARFAEAMESLDTIGLRMVDGRPMRVRLAQRATRGALAHHEVNPAPSIPFR